MSSPPSDQHASASHPSSWSLLDFNDPLSCLLPQELLHSSPFISSHQSPSPSPSPSLNPSQLLSSHSSMGPSTTKVSKRKSRAVNKPPIRVLSADRASFRDMVQKLTGIPTSPSLQAGRLWGAAGTNPSSIFRPMVGRPGYHQSDFTSAAAHQSMPTLDTSSAYLTRGFSHNNLMYNEVGNTGFNSTSYNATGGSGMGSFKGAGYAEGGNTLGPADMENMRTLRRASELESLFMGSNKLDDLLPSRIDPWLSSDVIHTPTPHVEIAHSA